MTTPYNRHHPNRLRPSVLPAALSALMLTVAGCSGKPLASAPADTSNTSGYYGGDRPPQNVPVNLDEIADAVPRHEPLSATGNKPYTALGKRYYPLASAGGYVKRGTASWYGSKFHGRRTSSGEPYDMFAMTAAHPVLPLPTFVRVTNLDNGKSVVVKVNDRGPFLHNRIIDLSYAAAHKLDIAAHGTGRVEVRALDPGDGAASPGASAAVTETQTETQTQKIIMLQVGAYSNPDNAAQMRRLLELAGYPVRVSASDTQGGAVYRVRVGPFASHEEAHTSREKLESMLSHPVTLMNLARQ